MEQHQTVKDVYGPGTYTDTEYIPPVEDCERLLKHLASISPGFTKDAKALAAVQFHGSDLPILPSPIKAQALVSKISLFAENTADCMSVCCHPCYDRHCFEGDSANERHRSRQDRHRYTPSPLFV